MKKRNFLHDLFIERKLQIVNPSENVAESYMKKSNGHLASAKLLRDHEHYEEAISMAYYSMYHGAMALFFRTGIKCENHSATIVLLKEIYGVDSAPLSEAKRERIDTQYYIDTITTRKNVEDLIHITEHFNAQMLDLIERLTNQKIATYRERLRILLE